MGNIILIAFGCASLGIIVGGLIGHYVAKAKEFSLQSLTGVVGLLSGAGIIGLFKLVGGEPGVAAWWYPIGVLIGIGGIAALNYTPESPEA